MHAGSIQTDSDLCDISNHRGRCCAMLLARCWKGVNFWLFNSTTVTDWVHGTDKFHIFHVASAYTLIPFFHLRFAQWSVVSTVTRVCRVDVIDRTDVWDVWCLYESGALRFSNELAFFVCFVHHFTAWNPKFNASIKRFIILFKFIGYSIWADFSITYFQKNAWIM